MILRLLKRLKNKLFLGIVIGICMVFIGHMTIKYTAADTFCGACHVHPHVITSWRLSTHHANKSGVVVHCVECHLPAGGISYYTEKARLGVQDVWGKLFKDIEVINWEEKSKLENAVTYTYKSTCLRCHQNLFPLELTKKGEEAHLYYTRKADQLRCLNCHLYVGHYSELAAQEQQFGIIETKKEEIYTEPAKVEKFEDYTEYIPGSGVKFDMVVVPAGTFTLGSAEDESYREPDEGPARQVKVSKFWMAKTEVTWDEYEAFYRQTASEGRTDTQEISKEKGSGIEAITGATPPYGTPDQGWGKGSRPAITMTHHAATVYCQWLSKVTGKKYRLPTEAEWEYACRGGTDSPYFFEGDPKKYTQNRFLNRIFGADTTVINSYVINKTNSEGKTHPPERVRPNPFGLLNMSGNVREFCLDWYAPDAYGRYSEDELIDPAGPQTGTEHVVRGGSYKNDAVDVRSAARDNTRHDAWLLTDPQIPKSIWWYSDCTDVGFRVVCEFEEEGNK